ncbi:MAG: beta-1,3-glucanase family protein, partial [Bacteroidota bacterium]
ATDWVNNSNWYTNAAPIYYYSKILHEAAIGGLAYALSYDDIFGTDPSIYIAGHPDVNVTFGAV